MKCFMEDQMGFQYILANVEFGQSGLVFSVLQLFSVDLAQL